VGKDWLTKQIVSQIKHLVQTSTKDNHILNLSEKREVVNNNENDTTTPANGKNNSLTSDNGIEENDEVEGPTPRQLDDNHELRGDKGKEEVEKNNEKDTTTPANRNNNSLTSANGRETNDEVEGPTPHQMDDNHGSREVNLEEGEERDSPINQNNSSNTSEDPQKESEEENSPRVTDDHVTDDQEAAARAPLILDSEATNTRTENTTSTTSTPNATNKTSEDRMDDLHFSSKAEELVESESAMVNSELKKVYDKGGRQEVEMRIQARGNDKGERENDKVMTTIIHPESAPLTNLQCQTSDMITDTRRISTRNKKPPGIREDDDFLWYKTAQPL
jgi:hypothetical protein